MNHASAATATRTEERQRIDEARADFDAKVVRPYVLNRSSVLGETLRAGFLGPTHTLCRRAFAAGRSFQRPKAPIQKREEEAALVDWLANGKHSSLLTVRLFGPVEQSTEAPGEPDSTQETVIHELFAVFRAGARYAATGSPFRKNGAWSVPAAPEALMHPASTFVSSCEHVNAPDCKPALGQDEVTCDGCGRSESAPHTSDCLIALQQDVADGDAQARAEFQARGLTIKRPR
jgi:hypothetical protein